MREDARRAGNRSGQRRVRCGDCQFEILHDAGGGGGADITASGRVAGVCTAQGRPLLMPKGADDSADAIASDVRAT